MRYRYSREFLEPIVRACHSTAEVLRILGLKPTGGNHLTMKMRIRAMQLNTDHFTGRGWSRGKTAETSTVVHRITEQLRLRDENVFVENCPFAVQGPRLTKRLLKAGWPYRCSQCHLTKWQGETLTLHLDHINGINNDNRFENLRFLCPNCHQQTETWGKKGSRKLRRIQDGPG